MSGIYFGDRWYQRALLVSELSGNQCLPNIRNMMKWGGTVYRDSVFISASAGTFITFNRSADLVNFEQFQIGWIIASGSCVLVLYRRPE